jgi:quercetin dioxygenase-like cupin family protein
MSTIASKLAAAALVCFGVSGALAQEGGPVMRTPLHSSEWPAGYNATTITATFEPNSVLPRHMHPGVETGYVLEGELLLKIDGQDDRKMKPGDSWTVPANMPHSAAAGPSGLKVLVSYVLDKTKPFASPAP